MSVTLFSAIFMISILFSFRWLIEVVRPRKAELNLFSNGDNPSLSLWCFRIWKFVLVLSLFVPLDVLVKILTTIAEESIRV